jgi:alpha-amylase/alpha-mannosidase (GH57 family)
LAAPGGEFASPVCFFRDDELSDRIGFEYSKWPASDAVDDLVRRIERLAVAGAVNGAVDDAVDDAADIAAAGKANSAGAEEAVLSIIMDGENAWEYFPRNATEFLTLLYQRLGSHPMIRLTTFSAVLPHLAPRPLTRLVAGSWVYGTFSTWVGDAAKNRAWDLLINAKSAVDLALSPALAAAARERREPGPWVDAVLRQLAVCEASDWFWWLGEDNRMEDGPAFDLLYRQQLAGLYQLIGTESPAALEMSINSSLSSALDPGTDPNAGQRPAVAGAMRPAHE